MEERPRSLPSLSNAIRSGKLGNGPLHGSSPYPRKEISRYSVCNNYRTISLMSHPSKMMLKVLLNRLKPQAEEIIAEERAGFRTGRSTTEQIFNLIIICEKYLQHQQDLYNVFIDFKKSFDRVWHAALWTIMSRPVARGVHMNHVNPPFCEPPFS